VSKGGLLYNFSSKAKLLEALVEKHLDDFDAALTETETRHSGEQNSLLVACLELFAAERQQCQPPPSGVLAAMVENPELLAPIKRFKRALLDRMKANAEHENDALLVYLVLEGMRSLRLFDADILSLAEQDAAIRSLAEILADRR
jgi:AcrR family transcriptional regulator